MALFADPVHEEFAGLALGFAPYGGADVGEVKLLAGEVTPGDDDSFAAAFSKLAHRRIDEGDAAAASGHRATARDCYLRAACLLGISYRPLYGTPVDKRLADAFRQQMEVFDKAMALPDSQAEKLDVPYEGTRITAYLLRASGYEYVRRPALIIGGGWDSTLVENYFGIGAAAQQRGYHVILHDGPGQGRLLIDEGLPLCHDWEKVLTPVVDATLRIDVVDPDRIAYYAWSLGGYMAPRAASFEHRLAAVIADPGQLDVAGKFDGLLAKLGLDGGDEEKVMAAISGDRTLDWKIVKRGFWTNNAPDLASWLAEMAKWKLDREQVAQIRCPALITAAESDLASSDAKELFDALTGSKTFLRFEDADGAGDHCEALNRSMANRKILDWLDDTLAK